MIFNCEEKKKNNFKRKYFNLSYRYRDYNDTIFDEIIIELQIFKFASSRRIETLTAFLFAYHLRRLAVEAELVKYE